MAQPEGPEVEEGVSPKNVAVNLESEEVPGRDGDCKEPRSPRWWVC